MSKLIRRRDVGNQKAGATNADDDKHATGSGAMAGGAAGVVAGGVSAGVAAGGVTGPRRRGGWRRDRRRSGRTGREGRQLGRSGTRLEG